MSTKTTDHRTKPQHTPEVAPLTPAEYAKAIGYHRALATGTVLAAIQHEQQQIETERQKLAEARHRLAVERDAHQTDVAALRQQREALARLTATHRREAAASHPHPEPTTAIHPAALTLTPPPPPPTPLRIKATSPNYTPKPPAEPIRPLPPLDHHNPESVRRWALRRFPDTPDWARTRLALAQTEADLWIDTHRAPRKKK